MLWSEIIRQFAIAKMEKMLLTVIAFITLTQLKAMIGILIALASAVVTIYFAVRKHKAKERQEREKHILEIIKKMDEAGLFEDGMTYFDKKEMAIKHIKEN